MKILLDNGHGKDTSGKRSPIWKDGSQLFEYEFNRDIVKKLYEKLIDSGYDCKIIVPEINDISLPERVKRVNDIYTKDKNCFLISIHANGGRGTGWECYTTIHQTESDKLSAFLYKSAVKDIPQFKLRTNYIDGDSDKEENFYILKYTSCPAVLTENLFMDTESDCKYIMSNLGRNAIVQLHYDGIAEYIKSKQ